MQEACGLWARRCEDQRKLKAVPWPGYFRVGDGRIKARPSALSIGVLIDTTQTEHLKRFQLSAVTELAPFSISHSFGQETPKREMDSSAGIVVVVAGSSNDGR